MCGVAGFLNLDGSTASRAELLRMTTAIEHRGPDGEGLWVDKNLALGHRRLSIIDLSETGSQPMLSQNGRYALSYNGEIYNYKELRGELTKLGWSFRGGSDTEVLLNSLIQWGTEALLKLNGMFAFAFWDKEKRELLLARDRFGVKPLYFAVQGNTLFFASEQKSILANTVFRRTLNKAALVEYLTFQNILSNQTLVEGIEILPAGNFAILNGSSKTPKKTQYWDFKFSDPLNRSSENEYIEELDRLFQQSVKRQMISDVEVGSYLSGGIDSGSITAIASRINPNLKTFTVGFDLSSASGMELGFDERQKAEAMSAVFKTEHYETVLKSGDMERSLSDLAWHLEEPRVGQSYPNYYAAKLASTFVKVVMSGAGGDELFGGYPWRYFHGEPPESYDDYIDSYYLYWQRLVSNSELARLTAPIAKDVKGVWTRDIFKAVLSGHETELNRTEDYINNSLYFEAKTFLHGLLVVEDKLSMAHGLETRVPFLDNDLVDFSMRVPVSLKIRNLHETLRLDENEPADKKEKYFEKTREGKAILRDAMSRHIPLSVTQLKKQGFSGPDASWFQGESIEFVRRRLVEGESKIFEILDREAIRDLLGQHFAGEKNRRLLVWSLLNLDSYLEQTF